MEFISGFQWAIPMAFADSVGKARFVEGDILYDNAAAYRSDWWVATSAINHTIQVRWPARASDLNDQSERDVFKRNWDSEVRLELYSQLQTIGSTQIKSTQGRLYTALWKGNLDALFEEKTPTPHLPVTAHQISKNIEKFRRATLLSTAGYTSFVMVRDICNAISRDKFQKIAAKLRPYMSRPPTLMTPEELNLPDFDLVTPTVDIAVFTTPGIDQSQLEELVKQTVYVPGKGAMTSMFRLSSHGIII